METLKHECGIATIRLLKPLSYYKEKYGSYGWALEKLYLLMEKQHNRGQEAAGIGVVKLFANPGSEYVFRERALGKDAIQEVFDSVKRQLYNFDLNQIPPKEVAEYAPFLGEIYLGHLRYSTTGKAGMSYVHPFLRRNNWRSRNLLLCGNFNMTNVDEIFQKIIEKGQHPRIYSDTVILLEQLGYSLDKENHRLYKQFRDSQQGQQLTDSIEENLDIKAILSASAPLWDGGFVICGATGSGDMFALRDSNGIRPAFYYHDDELVVCASERPVLQTVFNIPRKVIKELEPGEALIVNKKGDISLHQILKPNADNRKCSFERIYFSRGSDADIYRERKKLGANLVPQIIQNVKSDFNRTIFSFIPNTAEVAFLGMTEALQEFLEKWKTSQIIKHFKEGDLDETEIKEILAHHLRIEKLAIKDIKLRTFITEGEHRNDLASHVYDVTYGIVENDKDTLVLLDDSIVRGTTLRQSILKILYRLHPKKIVIVSSAPQVRYPDCYGIDMSSLSEFAAFRAAVALLKEKGMGYVLDEVYNDCLKMEQSDSKDLKNCVKKVYSHFTEKEISKKMAEMLTPPEVKAEVALIFQSIEGLHDAIPDHKGDWYFSGDYPTSGGIRICNRAFINYYESTIKGKDEN